MIRCIVVDDEPPALAILADYIRQIPFLELIATTLDPLEGLLWMQQGRADLVFLDIQMPRLTGLQFLRLCGSCKAILTTAYPEYAVEGFENDVLDYLLKPISFERFLKAVGKAKNIIFNNPILPISSPLASASDYIFVKGETKNKYLRLNYADILYVEGLHNYVIFHLASQRVVTYQTLKEMAELLPEPPFLRVHKSYIVSLNHVRLLDGNMLYIQDKAIPVGDTYREQLYRLVRASSQSRS